MTLNTNSKVIPRSNSTAGSRWICATKTQIFDEADRSLVLTPCLTDWTWTAGLHQFGCFFSVFHRHNNFTVSTCALPNRWLCIPPAFPRQHTCHSSVLDYAMWIAVFCIIVSVSDMPDRSGDTVSRLQLRQWLQQSTAIVQLKHGQSVLQKKMYVKNVMWIFVPSDVRATHQEMISNSLLILWESMAHLANFVR